MGSKEEWCWLQCEVGGRVGRDGERVWGQAEGGQFCEKEYSSLFCFGSVPHLSVENLFNPPLNTHTHTHLEQLEVMSKGCADFLFDLHSCRTEQFNLSFPSLPVACGACLTWINGCLWMIASGMPLMRSPCYVKYFYLLVEKLKLTALKTTSAGHREHSTQGRIYTFERPVSLLCELQAPLLCHRTHSKGS